MVNEPSPRAVERDLAVRYAPADAREGLIALLALDAALAAILRTTRDPIVGQMRLTWWHEALCRLDTVPVPAQPVLQALGRAVVPAVSGERLAGMIDGWEALLEEPLDDAAMLRFAQARGGRLFAAAAGVLGGTHPALAVAGEGWALADLAVHLGDPARAAVARRLADERLRDVMRLRWPERLRSLGALALLARRGEPGSPTRVARLLWHRATGA